MMRFPAASLLLTVQEMATADRLAVQGGIGGFALMQAAGQACARIIQRRYAPVPALVLCGPGNNGGDGFIIASHLAAAGWNVRVATLGAVEDLGGDAARAAALWDGETVRATPEQPGQARLVVDALFGAGLNRDLSGTASGIVEALARCGAHRVAIDVPSGLDGDTGEVRGTVAPADLTVSFFRAKPGHLLLPGRILCGVLRIVDIGIPATVLETIAPAQARNDPAIWAASLPAPTASDHKYRRGHALVLGGPAMTGAARFAAAAARRVGCGMLTLAVPEAAGALYRSTVPGALVRSLDHPPDRRLTAVLAGPGLGTDRQARAALDTLLAAGRPTVLDADALTMFTGASADLAERVRGPLVATPHEGEFVRLFPDLAGRGKVDRAREGAARLGGVLVLKGADTVIADPGGAVVINDNAPPWLATGGSGDVLAGTVAGLLAQGVPPFEAAAASVWLNGRAAARAGRGMVAEDLPDILPRVLEELEAPARRAPHGD